MRPFLAESFPEVTFFVSNSVVSAEDANAVIARDRPDLVLHVFAERCLEYLVDRDRKRNLPVTRPGSS